MEFIIFILLILGVIVYFIPALVANNHQHPQTGAITILNLFLGWTLLGWVIALVWACSKQEPQKVVIQNEKASLTDELVKLAELKDKGILTEDEFNAKKKQILEKE